MTCLTCGQQLPAERLFCPVCATPAGGPPVEPGARTRAVRGLGAAAAAAVGVVALIDLLTAVAMPVTGGGLAHQALDTGDPQPLNYAAVIEAVLGVIYMVALVAAGVLVIIWLWRARKNLDAFPGAPRGMRAGWAIGGWFIPFANLVIPFRVTATVARASLWRSKTPPLVGWWWAMWILGSCVSTRLALADIRAYQQLPLVLQTEDDFQQYIDYYLVMPLLLLPGALLHAVAGGLLIWLILSISRAQEARILRGRAGPLMPGAPVAVPPGA
jgi:hypothetical protein